MTSGPIGAVNMHVSENGDIYVVSRNINNIYKSTKQDPTASILFNDNDFHLANSIALDSTGNVYVSGQNMQLRKWTKSTSVSSTLEGGYGSRAIHIDSNDNLLIAKDGQYSGYNSEGLLAPSSGATIDKYKINTPELKESYYYRKIFESYYPNRGNLIPHFWLPKWNGNGKDPSARELNNYGKGSLGTLSF